MRYLVAGNDFFDDEGVSTEASSWYFVDFGFENCFPCSAMGGRDGIINGSTAFGPGATTGFSSFSEGPGFPNQRFVRR